MAIKALFTEGTTSITLTPLFQWDYGQELEIEAAGLPSLIEVHFACKDMTEAVVHTCSCVDGIATVAIPDRCLEQAGEITAWVYEIDGSAGRTIYSIKIPITARTRPARSESIPQAVQDTYMQLITEVNDLLGALQSGAVTVGYATKAGLADKATAADSATTATSANTAGSANKAVNDGDGNKISDTYIKMPKQYTELKYGDTLPLGLYQFYMMRVPGELDEGYSFLMDLGGGNHYPLHIYSPLMCDSGYGFNRIKFSFNASPSAPGYIFNTVEYSTIAASGTSYGLNFKEVEDSDTFAIYYNKLTI